MHEWSSAVLLVGHLATVKFGPPVPAWWKWPAAPLFLAAGAVCLAEGSQEQTGARWGWGVLLGAILSAHAVQCAHTLKLGGILTRSIAVVIAAGAIVSVALGIPSGNVTRGGAVLVSVGAALAPLLFWTGRTRTHDAADYGLSARNYNQYTDNTFVNNILAELEYSSNNAV